MVRTGTGRRSCQVSCTNCNCHHESSDEYELSGSSWNCRQNESWSESAKDAMAKLLDAHNRLDREGLARALQGIRILLGQ